MCVYAYGDLLHENSVGGLGFMQQAVHVLHAARGGAELLTQLLFGRLHRPHEWLWRPQQQTWRESGAVVLLLKYHS